MISARLCRCFTRSISKSGSLLNKIDVPAKRTLLSEAYQCREAWKERLQNSLIQNVDVENFGIKIQEKLDKEGKVSPVDIDIFANKLEQLDKHQLDFAVNLLYRFRHTRESIQVLPSTHYAVIHALLEFGEIERLLTILDDKINYGIFFNDYLANILMDHLLERECFAEAAKIAYEVMLQEDFSHPATRLLAWYACHMRLKDPKLMTPVVVEEPVQETTQDDDEDEEELVPIPFIINPYYDDHFDIPKETMLLGKTLTMITASNQDVMERSYQLMGWALYEKFEQGLEFLEEWLQDSNISESVTQDSLDFFAATLEAQEVQEPPEEKDPGLMRLEDCYPYVTAEQKTQFTDRLELLSQKHKSTSKIVAEADLGSQLLDMTKDMIAKVTKNDIENQKKQFKEWEQERQAFLDRQVAEIQMVQQKMHLVDRLQKLQEQEEKLRYFEEKNKIDMAVKAAKLIPTIKEVVEEEIFVPPPQERGKNFQG